VLVLKATVQTSAESPTGDVAAPSQLNVNPWSWDAIEKKVELPAMTNIVYFTFWLTNTSSEPATLLSTEAECDCTVVEARKNLPWRFDPGESGAINMRINTRGRSGQVMRVVVVHTSHGVQRLIAHINIPLTPAPSNVSVRQRDVEVARKDRQAVFKNGCASCHALPAAYLTGGALFDKACGICHLSKHRAEMVPELASVASGKDADYWRDWISYGKTGSLMPAFAKSEGGILDTNQIESLVEYLMQRYPADFTDKHPPARSSNRMIPVSIRSAETSSP